MFATALGKKRLIGVLLLAGLLSGFVVFSRAPKLDTIREDIDQSASVAAQTISLNSQSSEDFAAVARGAGGAGLQLLCVQGYCAAPAPEKTLVTRWWDFSSTYLRLVTLGMIFAFLVAGLTEVFLFPKGEGARFTGRGLRGTLQGLAAGTPMTLCSACIVPVANAVRRRGAGPEAVVALVQGSSTLNLPALIMLFVVFTPMMAGARIGVSLVAAIALGPLVAYTIRGRASAEPAPLLDAVLPARRASWGEVIRQGARDWPIASLGYFIRLGPIMVIAALFSGLVIQWLTVDTVQEYFGDNLLGIVIAAAIGVLINVPLLFEIPLVALLLVLGAGTAPAATLLFTAAAAGPITLWGLSRVMPRRAVATFGASTFALGVLGGLVVLGLASLAEGDGFGIRDGVVADASVSDVPTETNDEG